MKTFLLILLCSLLYRFGFAQSMQAIDSLKYELAVSKQDTNRVDILVDLAGKYWGIDPDSSLMYGQQSLALSRQIHYYSGESSSLQTLGVAYRTLGDYPKALDITFKGLQIAENNQLIEPTIHCLNGIALVYERLKDYSKAISYFRRGLKLAIPNHQLYWTAQLAANMGSAFKSENQIDSAFYYINNAYLKADSLKGTFLPKIVFQLMGEIQFQRGNYQNAFENMHKSILINQKTNDHRMLSGSYNTLSEFFKKLNQMDSSIFYAKKGLAEAQEIKNKSGILDASKLLAELSESKDVKTTLYYYKIANSTNDELYGSTKTLDLQKTLAEEQERQRQKEVLRIEYENQLKQYAYLTGLAILLLIAFLLYRNNRQKHKTNIVLQKQKEIVETTLSELKSTQAQLIQSEKMASLGELTAGIAHEIQNPLNFVNNFSELNNELANELDAELTTGNEQYAKGNQQVAINHMQQAIDLVNDIKENSEKINHHGKRAESIVKGMLEHSRKSSGIKEPTDINKLCDEFIRLSYHGLRAKDNEFNCDYTLNLDPALPLVKVVSQDIGRVLLNIINNAFQATQEKAQKDKDYKPNVTVTTKILSKSDFVSLRLCEIKITDNGPGIPENIKDKIFQPFFTTKPTGQGTGLGLSLAYDIVKAHRGELKVETPPGGQTGKDGVGSTFIISLLIDDSI